MSEFGGSIIWFLMTADTAAPGTSEIVARTTFRIVIDVLRAILHRRLTGMCVVGQRYELIQSGPQLQVDFLSTPGPQCLAN